MKNHHLSSQTGIDKSVWHNYSVDKDRMQKMPGMSGMAPLHTHKNGRIIHVESSVKRNYVLGDFFNIWGFDLNGKTVVNATVDEKSISDYKNHILKDKEKIYLNFLNNTP